MQLQGISEQFIMLLSGKIYTNAYSMFSKWFCATKLCANKRIMQLISHAIKWTLLKLFSFWKEKQICWQREITFILTFYFQ